MNLLLPTHDVPPRGTFIVFEGLDRSGKTTQCKLLADALLAAETPTVLLSFPDQSTPVGTLLHTYLSQTVDDVSDSPLNDHAIHLLFSANRWELAHVIESHLAAGTTVVCDRYAYSGAAYSTAKGLDLGWCMQCDKRLPAPDVVFYLQISPKEAAKREHYGEHQYDTIDFQEKVNAAYVKINLHDTVRWTWLNARLPPEQLHVLIHGTVQRIARDIQRLNTPLGKLWCRY